jgi:hypothetical protein
MGRIYSMHGREEKCMRSWSEILKGGDHSEDLGVDEKILQEWILGKQCGKVWIR